MILVRTIHLDIGNTQVNVLPERVLNAVHLKKQVIWRCSTSFRATVEKALGIKEFVDLQFGNLKRLFFYCFLKDTYSMSSNHRPHHWYFAERSIEAICYMNTSMNKFSTAYSLYKCIVELRAVKLLFSSHGICGNHLELLDKLVPLAEQPRRGRYSCRNPPAD